MNTKLLTLSFLFTLLVTAAWGQTDKASRPSPPATATGKIGEATITINYSSPAVNGRQVWGALVPYDSVWRAGANEATIFETDKPLTVGGQALPAGKYSLFAVPGVNEWKFIFNSQTGQWGVKRGGVANRDPANDVLTVTAKPMPAANTMHERLNYIVNSNNFALRWERLEVPVSIK
jgi:hypothetical protein